MRVRVDLNISLDGYAAPEGTSPTNPMGEDWAALTSAYVATRSFRERVFHDHSGSGTTGVDDRYGAAYFEGVGAEIMGAGMFGFHTFPDDPTWSGWWGDEPPFGCPVFVRTHRQREDLTFANGTSFHFTDAATEDVLERAVAVAQGADVRVGGGVETVRAFLTAGLVDVLHVAVVPIILGRGVSLWRDLRGLEAAYEVTTEAAESGVAHVTFSRPPTRR